MSSGIISANRWGLSDPWGVSVYVTYCFRCSNAVSKIQFTGKN